MKRETVRMVLWPVVEHSVKNIKRIFSNQRGHNSFPGHSMLLHQGSILTTFSLKTQTLRRTLEFFGLCTEVGAPQAFYRVVVVVTHDVCVSSHHTGYLNDWSQLRKNKNVCSITQTDIRLTSWAEQTLSFFTQGQLSSNLCSVYPAGQIRLSLCAWHTATLLNIFWTDWMTCKNSTFLLTSV